MNTTNTNPTLQQIMSNLELRQLFACVMLYPDCFQSFQENAAQLENIVLTQAEQAHMFVNMLNLINQLEKPNE
jgi:hypothetical protein